MNSILKYAAIAVLIYIAGRIFGFLGSLFITLIVLIAFLWIKRASLLTRLATSAYFVKGNIEKASKLFEKAYKTGEMSADSKIAYSSFCLRENKLKTCKKLLNEVINSRFSTSEDKLGAKHNLSVLMWKEGNLEEAFNLMQTVHKSITSSNTYGTLGVLYIEKAKQGDREGALEFLKEAYEYNDSDKTIADNLGEMYYILGEYESAKEIYEKLLEKDFTTPVPYYNYGRVLKKLGENEKAINIFNKALTCRFTNVMTITKDDVQNELNSL